jgi:hypothetical protein
MFAREEENAETFAELSDRCRKSWLKAVGYSNLVWPGIDNISGWVRAAVFIVGLIFMGAGEVSLGVIFAITKNSNGEPTGYQVIVPSDKKQHTIDMDLIELEKLQFNNVGSGKVETSTPAQEEKGGLVAAIKNVTKKVKKAKK